MNAAVFALAAGAAVLALASRAYMKGFVGRKAGKVVPSLLEADFWKAASGRPIARALVVVELASWAGLLAAVLDLASGVLGL